MGLNMIVYGVKHDSLWVKHDSLWGKHDSLWGNPFMTVLNLRITIRETLILGLNMIVYGVKHDGFYWHIIIFECIISVIQSKGRCVHQTN